MSKRQRRTSKLFDPIFNNEVTEVIKDDEGHVIAEVYLVPEYKPPKKKVRSVKPTKKRKLPANFTTDTVKGGYKFFRWNHAK